MTVDRLEVTRYVDDQAAPLESESRSSLLNAGQESIRLAIGVE
jgi:hypothetical protein